MQSSHVATRDDAAVRPHTTEPRRNRVTRLALAAAASALASASFAGPALAAHKADTARPTTYNYTTVVNNADPTFNQLLGINKSGEISGYFGSGAAGHPNQGYLTNTGNLGSFTPENFSESVQTQVTGLNDNGVTVGFWSDTNIGDNMDANFGFWSAKGHYHTVVFPSANAARPELNQLLGVNDSDLAVGSYVDAQGNGHGYTYNILTDTYHEITIPGATSVTTSAINNRGDVAGFFTDAQGTHAFIRSPLGLVRVLNVPGASSTQVFGINDHREVVGDYTGSDGVMHGFTWAPTAGFQTVDDPHGIGTTTLNGVNDSGEIVGFYVDADMNTDGMLATPASIG